MTTEFFSRYPERGVFKRVRSVIIRPSQTPPTVLPRGNLTRSLSARGDAEKRRRGVLRRQNAIDDHDRGEIRPSQPFRLLKILSESDTWMTMAMTSRPTSLSDAGIQLSSDALTSTLSSENLTSDLTLNSLADYSLTSPVMGEDGKRCDDNSRAKSRMEKYFAEKPDKNIFMKLIHPSYHERNLQFKKIFVDKGLIEQNDQFLASYSCAYQREILAQGRMFISQFNVCFYANIIGWETTLVIPMKEIKLIKKMKAALIFPNSIQFERDNDTKYFFASFVNRDKSFQVLTTAHNKVIEEGRAMTREEVWDMVYNSEDKNPQNQTPPDSITPASTKNASTENMTALSTSTRSPNGSMKQTEKDNTSQSSTSSGDIHDDSSGDPTFEEDVNIYEDVPCPCSEHFGRLLFEQDYKISLEKFYELAFTETSFLSEFNERIKVGEYVAATWVRDHRGENSRTCTYTVSLSNPLAPKAIIVNEKQTLQHFPNPRHGLMISKETQNSGVPYAEHFTVNCKYCITRTGANSCRVKVHGGIQYKKNLWVVKTFIDKGTNQGLDEHYNLLRTMMEEFMKKNPDGGSVPPPNIIPFLRDETPLPKSDLTVPQNGHLRHRLSRKSTPERLMAGGENKQAPNSSVDKDFTVEMRPRATAEFYSLPTATVGRSATKSSEYKPFLIVIIVLLAFFFTANLYILQTIQTGSQHVVSKKEENLGEVLSVLMEQIRELKDKVDQMQKNN